MNKFLFTLIASAFALPLMGMEMNNAQKQIIPLNANNNNNTATTTIAQDNHNLLKRCALKANKSCDTVSNGCTSCNDATACSENATNGSFLCCKGICMTLGSILRLIACGIDVTCLVPATVGRPCKSAQSSHKNDAFFHCSRGILEKESHKQWTDCCSPCTKPYLKSTQHKDGKKKAFFCDIEITTPDEPDTRLSETQWCDQIFCGCGDSNYCCCYPKLCSTSDNAQ